MSHNDENAGTDSPANRGVGLSGGCPAIAVHERPDSCLPQSKSETVADRLLQIGKDCAAHLEEPFSTLTHGDLLYDENGLPK